MSYARRRPGLGAASVGAGAGQCPAVDLARNLCGTPDAIYPCSLVRECDDFTGGVHWQYQLPAGAAPNANIWTVNADMSQAQRMDAAGVASGLWAPVRMGDSAPAPAASPNVASGAITTPNYSATPAAAVTTPAAVVIPAGSTLPDPSPNVASGAGAGGFLAALASWIPVGVPHWAVYAAAGLGLLWMVNHE